MKLAPCRYCEARPVSRKMKNRLNSILGKMNQKTKHQVFANKEAYKSEIVHRVSTMTKDGQIFNLYVDKLIEKPQKNYTGYAATIEYDNLCFQINDKTNTITPMVKNTGKNVTAKKFENNEPLPSIDEALIFIQKTLDQINKFFNSGEKVQTYKTNIGGFTAYGAKQNRLRLQKRLNTAD